MDCLFSLLESWFKATNQTKLYFISSRLILFPLDSVECCNLGLGSAGYLVSRPVGSSRLENSQLLDGCNTLKFWIKHHFLHISLVNVHTFFFIYNCWEFYRQQNNFVLGLIFSHTHPFYLNFQSIWVYIVFLKKGGEGKKWIDLVNSNVSLVIIFPFRGKIIGE